MIRPLTLKPKQTYKPSSYLLEVVTAEPQKRITKGKTRGGFSAIKNVLVAMLLAMFMLAGTGTAALANTTSNENANAADLFNMSTWVCPYKDNPGAYLNGVSKTTTDGFNDAKRNPAINSGFNITIQASGKTNPYVDGNNRARDGARWTALEQYGYFGPSFEDWKGLLYEDIYKKGEESVWPFVGTGGKGDGYGPLVAISDPQRSLMLNKDFNSCLGDSTGAALGVGIANGLFSVSKFMTMLAGETYGVAMNMDITNASSPLHGLATGVEDLILGKKGQPDSGLKDLLYLDWLVGIIFISTLWLLYVGIVRRSFLAAGQAVIWMIGASIGGIILLNSPLLVPSFIDEVASSVSSSITTAIIPADAASSDICTVPNKGDNGDRSIRQVKCSLWYMTVYTPWVKGQFGVNEYDLDKDSRNTGWMYKDNYVSSRPGAESNATPWGGAGDLQGEGFKEVEASSTPTNMNASRGVLSKADIRFGDYKYTGDVNWALYMMDRQNNNADNRGMDYSEIAFNQLVVNENDVWKAAGDSGGSAMLSIFSAAGPTILMIAMNLTLIGLQLSMLFLIALSPLFFLVGAAPGWGRRIAMRWIELVVGILAKRIILTLFLILFLQIYFLIVRAEMDWWIQSLLVLTLSIVAFTQRNKVTSIFNDAISFGGDKRFDDGRQSLPSRQEVINRTNRGIKTTGKTVSWVASRRVGKANQAAKAATAGALAGAAVGAVTGPRGSRSRAAATNSNPSTAGAGVGTVPLTRAQHREKTKATAKAEVAEFKKRNWENKRPAQRSVEVRKRQFVEKQNALHQARVANKEELNKLDQQKANGTISNRAYAKEKARLHKERAGIKAQTVSNRESYDKDIKKVEGRSQRMDDRINKRFDKNWAKESQSSKVAPKPTTTPPASKPSVKPASSVANESKAPQPSRKVPSMPPPPARKSAPAANVTPQNQSAAPVTRRVNATPPAPQAKKSAEPKGAAPTARRVRNTPSVPPRPPLPRNQSNRNDDSKGK